VPDGGVAVGQAPDGNLSVAAIQVDTGGGASSPKLSLSEAGGQGQQAATLQVCTTADGWISANGGDYGIAPRATCPQTPLAMARDSNGTWSADLSSVLAGKSGEVSLMIVPGPTPAALPAGAQPGAFQITFNPPAGAGTTAPSPAESSDTQGAFTAPSYDTTPAPNLALSGSEVPTPQLNLGQQPEAVTPSATPAVTSVGGQAAIPIRTPSTPKPNRSRLVIIGWFVLASAVGAAAAGWHWARDAGAFDRLTALRARGGLLPPPS
jgi:hypothetical protein